jgi:hypothetical protein
VNRGPVARRRRRVKAPTMPSTHRTLLSERSFPEEAWIVFASGAVIA